MKNKYSAHGILAIPVFMITALTGCKGEQFRLIQIEGVSYNIPEEDIRGVLGPDEGGLYVRLRPADQPFMLTYYERVSDFQRNHSFPVVADISDRPLLKHETIEDSGEVIHCRGPGHYNCGIQLNHGSILWSVRFDRSKISDVVEVKKNAMEWLDSFVET